MSRARFHAKFPLLQPALEGVSRYGHRISVEYFSDLSNVLLQLLGMRAVPFPDRLQCLQTASDLLRCDGTAGRTGLHRL
jgi:hypothetical protein